MAGEVYAFKFPDGSIEYAPRALWDSIVKAQRARWKGMEGGKLGGRPTEKPKDVEILLRFGEKWLAGDRLSARFQIIRALAKQYHVSLKTARRWTDAVIGKRRKIKRAKTP